MIHWPEDMDPEGAALHTANRLSIDSPIEIIWAWLVRAGLWSSWYSNCKRLRFESGSGPDLGPGSDFSWVTFGVRVRTRVEEFEAPTRLGWRGTGLGASGYHAWLLEPTASGCHVVTEEVQRGLVPSLGRGLIRLGLLHYHQGWLEGLARVASTGEPPD